MARATFRLSLDDSSIADLTMPGGLADQATARVAGRVRDRAKQIVTAAGRVDTGALRQSLVSERVAGTGGGGQAVYRVGSTIMPQSPARYSYAVYQHQGVRGPIYPRRAKVLRWRATGPGAFAARRFGRRGGWVFARHVKGFQGVPYLTDAASQVFGEL